MDKRHPVRKILTALVEFNARTFGRKTPVVRRFTLGLADLPAGFDGCRIVQLSDLHARSFGEGQKKLLDRVAAERPDLIFITGDLLELNYGEKERSAVVPMLRGCAAIAPCYFCLGNHETRSDPEILEAELRDLREAGIRVLDGEVITLGRGGSEIALGGIWVKPECPLTEMTTVMHERELRSLAAVREQWRALGEPWFILLAHRPECPGYYRRAGAKLVFSGHDHGGLMPWGRGGLIAPGQGWNAKRVKGVFREEGMTTVISAGLGGPRICIPPELVSVEMKKLSTARKA